MENYNVQYFINKFENIPEDKWTTFTCTDDNGNHCAMGHCGGINGDVYATEESNILSEILHDVVLINDGHKFGYYQTTPKQRILAALYDIRDKQIEEANVKAALELVNTNEELLLK